MSADNLEMFPPESVAMESPRLAWLRKHALCTYHVKELRGECPETGNTLKPWTCCKLELPGDVLAGKIGIGDTEDECCADYAQKHGLKLWNEENP